MGSFLTSSSRPLIMYDNIPPLHAERCTPKDHVCLIVDLAAVAALTQALAAMQRSGLMAARLHPEPVRLCRNSPPATTIIDGF